MYDLQVLRTYSSNATGRGRLRHHGRRGNIVVHSALGLWHSKASGMHDSRAALRHIEF